MVIVTGHLLVDPADRDAYLGRVDRVRAVARAASHRIWTALSSPAVALPRRAPPPCQIRATPRRLPRGLDPHALADCRQVVELGRAAEGCLDFALSADLLDPARINILERWEGQEVLEAFRGAGTPDELGSRIRHAEVSEHDVASSRSLT